MVLYNLFYEIVISDCHRRVHNDRHATWHVSVLTMRTRGSHQRVRCPLSQ